MKKNILYILIIVILVGLFSPVYKSQAQTQIDPDGICTLPDKSVNTGWKAKDCAEKGGTWEGPYVLLSPLPEVGPTFNPGDDKALGTYLNLMLIVFIGISAVLSVVMIVVGGIEYMTSELISSKEAGKERIRNALLGLFIALGAYTLLYTINPNLLDIKSIAGVSIPATVLNSIYEKPVTAANIARCTPVTSGPCATANLSTFGAKADAMSKICNIESGGNANAQSGTDIGTDGTVFSFGLFQINLLSNGSIINDSSGNSCANLFTLSDGSPIVRGNYIKRNSSGKVYYDAKLKPGMEAKYASCKSTLLDPVKNTQIARVLFQQGTSAFNNSMFAWKGDQKICASAFN